MLKETRENPKAQSWVENTINHEIKACQTSIVETLLQLEQLDPESVQNQYPSFNDKSIVELQEHLDEVAVDYESEDVYCDDILDVSDYENYLRDEAETYAEPQEILEYWLVSEWLANQLIEAGEPVVQGLNCSWWGRTCSGQAISLDPTLWDIWENLNN